ncbi:acyl-coenzyme A:6-aminopenicillanic-acid-acyltransferase form [Dacryopinax primogenitus]|uniref:Acyl-coenzyme A:6-aminopenicillanic-acid-acyltransferase form n=1 Tax=Dacryopinax primogenitus (strain DJM 731) TaxID=1858805 RepID=M5G758_DACPD|nr:acyl-coenzyme A:6-aminopenicillanic-acid-acyltransferase form [Dacryopinax primogenitus]EJT99597.1 acyl-coenzyme A:6-aminopenicillanic-acid-acyltransferase form [Dacryopinax primogenitus]
MHTTSNSPLLVINCKGSPREIGLEHGTKAADKIKRGIEYYKGEFMRTSDLPWDKVCDLAMKFDPQMEERYPWLKEEMQAIADGADVKYTEVLALNFRQEVIFGMYADGCTSLAWKTHETSFLAQNWDWMIEQKDNVIVLNIDAPGKPRISMGTEAGIIGKIGLNSSGVGVCANGIRVKGVDYNGTPVHICRRLVLESETRDEAIAKIEKYGTAASGHMLVGDKNGCIGLECTTRGIKKLYPDGKGRILHTNHLLAEHEGSFDNLWLKDSPVRLERLTELANQLGRNPNESQIAELFKDDPYNLNQEVDDYDSKDEVSPPKQAAVVKDKCQYGINRAAGEDDRAETLFNIIMDLPKASAIFKFGRPHQPDEVLILTP